MVLPCLFFQFNGSRFKIMKEKSKHMAVVQLPVCLYNTGLAMEVWHHCSLRGLGHSHRSQERLISTVRMTGSGKLNYLLCEGSEPDCTAGVRLCGWDGEGSLGGTAVCSKFSHQLCSLLEPQNNDLKVWESAGKAEIYMPCIYGWIQRLHPFFCN